jgi:hypothetical protein
MINARLRAIGLRAIMNAGAYLMIVLVGVAAAGAGAAYMMIFVACLQ